MESRTLRILVTGASRGLGRALSERFVEGGHTVLGCARSSASIGLLARRFGPPHSFHSVDVADPGAVADWSASVLAAGGPPDLLLNNAALMNRPAPLWDVPPDELARLLAVNVAGTHHVLAAFLPAMIERGSGVVVNFSSGWGRSTAPGVGPYCATKFAIEGLTQALASELPRGLAAVSFNPGIIDTDMLRQCWAEVAAAYPDADAWSREAAPRLLALGPEHNGRALSL